MKKSMIFVGLLAVGYANAQSTTDYTGRVGINTDTPNASLNVKSSNDTKSPKNLELENQSDKKLMTVLNNGKIGINNENPSVLLELNALDGSYAGNQIMLNGFRNIDGGPAITIGRARGSVQAPEVPKKGDAIGGLSFRSYIGKNKAYNGVADYYATGGITMRVTGEVEENKTPSSLLFHIFDDSNHSNQITSTKMLLHHTGNLGIGLGGSDATGVMLWNAPTEKLDVNGNARFRTLPSQTGGATDKLVVVDNTGVLKTVDRSAIAPANTTATNGVQNVASMECNATNRGKMNFIQGADGKSDVFGICMKNADGNYYWGYMVGGNNPTNGTGAFGSGL